MVDPHHLSTRELAEQCAEQERRYRQGGASDSIYCLELWRRALHEHSEEAWTHATRCFTPYLERKLGGSLGKAIIALRSTSATRSEAKQSIIDDGFAQLAAESKRRSLYLSSLAELLNYLWICTENMMRMELRDFKRHSRGDPKGGEPITNSGPPVDDVDPSGPDDTDRSAFLRAALSHAALFLRGCAGGSVRDFQAGKLLLFFQWKPEEIVASPQYRSMFPDVDELYRLGERLRKCVLEHLRAYLRSPDGGAEPGGATV